MPGPDAQQLTQEHRLRLAAVADDISRQVRELAAGADTSDIDSWWERIVKDLVALLAAAWRAIRDLTGMWLEDHAQAEGRTVDPVLAEWNTEQVLTSLRVTGPVAFKTAIAGGQDEAMAQRSMTSQLAGAAERLVLGADRNTVAATVDDSDEIVGWRRVSDGDPCAWCAMLISRGAVYKSGRTAGDVRFGGSEYHDGDRCTAEPLYEREPEPPEVAELYDEWLTVTERYSGDDKLKAWRRYWDNNRNQPAEDEPEPAREPEAPRRREPDPEPESVPQDDRRQRAVERQERVDSARARAELLAELEELAVINETDGDELARMARVAADRFGVADEPAFDRLLRAAADGDAGMVEVWLESAAERLGLTRIGGDEIEAVQIVRYDRGRHELLPGERATPNVEIVRPGYLADIGGEQVVVVRAKVAPTSADLARTVPRTEDTPAVAASRFYRSLDGLEDLAAIARAADTAERKKLYGGQSAKVELVILPDGRRAVSKRAEDWGDTSPEMQEELRHAADAEQLAYLLGRAIDAPIAKVYRDGEDHIWADFIEGSPDDVSDAMMFGDDGVRLGLLDALIANVDRNGGNMIGKDGRITGIDHGEAWRPQHMEDPAARFVGLGVRQPMRPFIEPGIFGLGEWKSNPLTESDIEIVRARIEALRPDFALVGREDWLDFSLAVLDELAKHADGARSLYG